MILVAKATVQCDHMRSGYGCTEQTVYEQPLHGVLNARTFRLEAEAVFEALGWVFDLGNIYCPSHGPKRRGK